MPRATAKNTGSLPAEPSAPQAAATPRRPATRSHIRPIAPSMRCWPADRRHIAGRPVAGLYGLGFASGGGAAAANGDVAGRVARRETVLRSCASLLLAPIQEPWSLIKPQPQDRRFAGAGVGASAVQFVRAGVSAERAMVARGDHRRARCGTAERGDRRVLGAAGARYAGAIQFRRYQSGSAGQRPSGAVARISCSAGRTGSATGCDCCPPASRPRTRNSSLAKPSRRLPARWYSETT